MTTEHTFINVLHLLYHFNIVYLQKWQLLLKKKFNYTAIDYHHGLQTSVDKERLAWQAISDGNSDF